jgi:hypothetical protein
LAKEPRNAENSFNCRKKGLEWRYYHRMSLHAENIPHAPLWTEAMHLPILTEPILVGFPNRQVPDHHVQVKAIDEPVRARVSLCNGRLPIGQVKRKA